MTITVSVAGFRDLAKDIEGDVARAATAAMRSTTITAKQELRDQVTSAGLGTRLANTWRGDVYPKSKQSANPAGFIHSNAPNIVDSFVRGATIVPVNGSRYLAIPTKNVPDAPGRRGARRKMTPAQVEAAFNQNLFVRPGREGKLLAFIDRALGKRGPRSKGQGARSKPVLMFTLVPSVRLPKLLDLNGPAQRWATAYEAEFARELA